MGGYHIQLSRVLKSTKSDHALLPVQPLQHIDTCAGVADAAPTIAAVVVAVASFGSERTSSSTRSPFHVAVHT